MPKPATDETVERTYCRLVRKLLKITADMERLGESDMGVLQERLARRFHRATDTVRTLTNELMQDSYWPHEGAPTKRTRARRR